MRNLAFNSLARAFVIIFQLVNIKLYTNYLTANELGVFFFLMAVSYSANAILFVPMDYFQQAKLVKVMTEFGGIRSLLIFNSKVIGSYIVFVLLLVFGTIIIYPEYTIYIGLVMLLALAIYIVQALRNTLNNLSYGNHVSISFMQEALIKVGLLYFLANLVKPDAILLIISWLLSLVITAIYLMMIATKKRIFSGLDGYSISSKEVFRFAYPFSVGAVANWLQLQGYRLALVPLGYSEVVGVFGTIAGIGSAAIGAASLIYGQQFSPRIYQSKGGYTNTYLNGAFVITVVILIFSYFLGEFVVGLLTGAHFIPHWKLILFGVLTDAANLFVGAIAIHISLVSCTKKLMGSAFLGLLSMIGFFALLYFGNAVTVNTVGIPLLLSQWCVVGYMYWKYIKQPSMIADNCST